jgi:hypothetical protein
MTSPNDVMRGIRVSEPRSPFGIRVSDPRGLLFTVADYDELRTIGLLLEAIANRRQALTADQAEQQRREFDRTWNR